MGCGCVSVCATVAGDRDGVDRRCRLWWHGLFFDPGACRFGHEVVLKNEFRQNVKLDRAKPTSQVREVRCGRTLSQGRPQLSVRFDNVLGGVMRWVSGKVVSLDMQY